MGEREGLAEQGRSWDELQWNRKRLGERAGLTARMAGLRRQPDCYRRRRSSSTAALVLRSQGRTCSLQSEQAGAGLKQLLCLAAALVQQRSARGFRSRRRTRKILNALVLQCRLPAQHLRILRQNQRGMSHPRAEPCRRPAIQDWERRFLAASYRSWDARQWAGRRIRWQSWQSRCWPADLEETQSATAMEAAEAGGQSHSRPRLEGPWAPGEILL